MRDEIQTGNLAIDGAKNGRFEAFFLPAAQWEQVREAFWARTGFPVDPGAAVERLKERLSDAFDRFLEGVADNRQVAFDDDGWRLKTDPAEPPDPAQSDRLAELHRWLDARSRTIRLADLLIEVENDLGFSVHFQQPGEKRVDPGEVCALLAAILAHGCNLGLYTMEKVAPDIAYRRLKYVSDWRLVEENQRAALAAIVHGISRLDAAAHWGDGTTSASDGRRFAMPHKVLQRTYSTRFNDFALEFYSFVADNYAPFYSRPIECTDRDAPFVLDGVLYHESDLNLEEHYTDTHGGAGRRPGRRHAPPPLARTTTAQGGGVGAAQPIRCSLDAMSTDTKWIIGTMLAGMTAMTAVLLTVVVSLVSDVRGDLGELRSDVRSDLSELRSDVRSDIDELRSDVRSDLSDVRGDLSRMDDRLRAVEIAFGKVDQRLATLERLHLPTPAAD